MFAPARSFVLAVLIVGSLVASCTSADSEASADTSVETEAAPTVTEATTPSTASSTTTTAPTTTATPTTTVGPTTTEVAEVVPALLEFAPAPASCLDLPTLPGLPPSQFIVMPEENIFDCLGVVAFESRVSFEGTVNDQDESILATSAQRKEAGVVSADAAFAEDDVVTEQLIRVGEELWKQTPSGTWEAGDFDVGYFFTEQGELRLSMSGALFIFSVYGGGAERVGDVELNGYRVVKWEADAEAIAKHFNGLGVAPVPVGLEGGHVNIWTTDEGIIVKLDGEIRADDVTLAGIPVAELDPADFGLPEDALDIVPDYLLSYELFDFDHDREITPPEIG